MKVSVFGLGYVGTVMMGCLSRAGHTVIGVDVKPEKVEAILSGNTPVVEPDLDVLIGDGVTAGRLEATIDPWKALSETEMSFVCVGTPQAEDGSVEVAAVESVCRQIGEALATKEAAACHTVVIRSTVMPGTTERCQSLIEKASGGKPGHRFTVCFNPEFLREGSAVKDFMDPPMTVIGATETVWAEPLRKLYSFSSAPFFTTSVREAELLKIVCNAWHATKVSFANEVGRLCSANQINPHVLMDIFARDERLNLSSRYLRPGFAYGGSCLPKDMSALVHLARRSQLDLPLLEGVPRSNTVHIERAKARILASGKRQIGFLGVAFKPDTDDLRGSPLVDLVEFCLGKGMTVYVHDPHVVPSRMVGRNRQVALERLGHLADLLVADLDDLAHLAELFVIGHQEARLLPFCHRLPKGKHILDLVGLDGLNTVSAHYEGLFDSKMDSLPRLHSH